MNDYNKKEILKYMKSNNLNEIETYISVVTYNSNSQLIILKPFKITIKIVEFGLSFYKISDKTKKYIKAESFITNNCGEFFLNEKDCIDSFNTKLYNELCTIKIEESILNKKIKMLENSFINTDYIMEKLLREK